MWKRILFTKLQPSRNGLKKSQPLPQLVCVFSLSVLPLADNENSLIALEFKYYLKFTHESLN
jgi:hypothetical protein